MNEPETTKPAANKTAKPAFETTKPVESNALARIGKLESLPVAMMKLQEANPIDIPGQGGRSSVNCVAADKVFDSTTGKRLLSSACHVVDFYPQLRHFRVIYYSHNHKDAPAVRMVHETHVRTWEPLG